MMRRMLRLLFLLVVVAACSSGGEPVTSTDAVSEPTGAVAAQRDAQWFSVVVDSVGLTGVGPHVLATSDGGLVIVYQREVEPGRFETLIASCASAECISPTIVQLTPPESVRLLDAGLGLDESPVVLVNRMVETDGDVESSTVLLVCSDPTCSSVEETVTADTTPMGLAVTHDGVRAIAYASSGETGSADIYVAVCFDAACRASDPVLVGSARGYGIASGALQLLPGGSPVLHYEDSPSPESSQRIVVACGDPACRSVEVTEVMPGIGTDQGVVMQNLPYWPYVSHDGSVGVIGCGDERCATILDRELYRRFDGTMIIDVDARTGPDGMPVLAVETISQERLSAAFDGDGYATHQVLWVLCGDLSCETVSVRELGEGDRMSMASLSDGSVVVAAQTGRPELCLEDCADPTTEGLSTLTLYACHGSDCASPQSADLVAASGDVSVLSGGVASAIVFTAEGDIHVLDPGRGTARRLTEGSDWEGGPVWSPDAARIAFHTDHDATEADRWENYNIYVMNADGSAIVQVTDDPAAEFFPDWSSDGTRLVFARQSEGSPTRHLVIIDLATGEERQLTDLAIDADIPAWSADGTKIAFSGQTSGDCSWEGTDCNTAIFTINVDGTGLTQLSDVSGIDAFPDWSPDGREIAFHSTRNDPTGYRWDIFVMNSDGREVFQLTDYAGADQFPTWSPDGTVVLFQSDRAGTGHLYTVRGTDGSDLTLIAPDAPNAGFPDWSPATN